MGKRKKKQLHQKSNSNNTNIIAENSANTDDKAPANDTATATVQSSVEEAIVDISEQFFDVDDGGDSREAIDGFSDALRGLKLHDEIKIDDDDGNGSNNTNAFSQNSSQESHKDSSEDDEYTDFIAATEDKKASKQEIMQAIRTHLQQSHPLYNNPSHHTLRGAGEKKKTLPDDGAIITDTNALLSHYCTHIRPKYNKINAFVEAKVKELKALHTRT